MDKKDKDMNTEKENQNMESQHEELTEIPQNEEQKEPATEKVAEVKEEPNEKSWEEKYHELYDTYLRLFSEFDNFRKRTMKERSDLIRTAGADVIQAMLPVMDDFERARKSMEESKDVESLKQGVELVFHKFKNTLSDKGLTEFNPVGEVFDAELHEALTNIPAQNAEDKGKILEVIEKGYKMGDRIIRYPKVVVYS